MREKDRGECFSTRDDANTYSPPSHPHPLYHLSHPIHPTPSPNPFHPVPSTSSTPRAQRSMSGSQPQFRAPRSAASGFCLDWRVGWDSASRRGGCRVDGGVAGAHTRARALAVSVRGEAVFQGLGVAGRRDSETEGGGG